MKINICCYERGWIFGKIAIRLRDHVAARGINCIVGDRPKDNVEVNHHIGGLGYNGKTPTINTLMVTHVDEQSKVDGFRKLLAAANMAICMSQQTMKLLVEKGLPAEKLYVVNPAHDGVIRPRKLNIGITSRLYKDGRKREGMVRDLGKRISPDDFCFTIMGSGWDGIVEAIRGLGFDVSYYPEFKLEIYNSIVPMFDYYLYVGQDEGSMGFLDACAAGVKTIVTTQGFHLDAMGGITYSFSDLDELTEIFKRIQYGRQRRIDSVADWTWDKYAQRHIEIWERCLNG